MKVDVSQNIDTLVSRVQAVKWSKTTLKMLTTLGNNESWPSGPDEFTDYGLYHRKFLLI